ncbi:MAG: TVP38/TMEM64 family protein [Rubripirellula sp.]|nr:TVP38/TMEM64 family protein [Rubripirellula sp.]
MNRPANKPDHSLPENGPGENQKGQQKWIKPITLLAVVITAVLLFWRFGEFVELDYLATKESQLQDFRQQSPLLVYGIALGVYVLVTGLSLPGAAALSLLYAWYFGFIPGVILISFASTLGATIAFLTSRFLLRDTVQSKFGDRLTSFNEHLKQQGAFYLFTLRLIPLVPFFVINLVMGLTPIRITTFWWVSQIGMLPGTCVYVYAGSRVPTLQTLADEGAGAVFTPSQLIQITIAFAMLGLFPVAAKRLLSLRNRSQAEKT